MPAQRSLRILMIVPSSFFGDYGGHIRIYEETLALQALGHRVRIVTYYKGRDLPGLDICRTPPLPYHHDYEVGSSRHKLAFDFYLAGRAAAEARRFQPDIIHGHMHEGALIGSALAAFGRPPLVFDFQGSLTEEMIDHGFLRRGGRAHRLARRLERFICHRPAAILTSSLRAGALLQEEFGVAPERIVPLPDCVDTRRFNPAGQTAAARAALKAHLGIPADRTVIAYLGILAPYQGTDYLLQVAAQLQTAARPAHFLIMGFPHVDRYSILAGQLGVSDRVTFTGKIPYEHAPAYLSLGDIAVSPKVSTSEGSGKVLNYMALAQPVVASTNPVHREYLGEHGCYVPVGDVAGFAAVLNDLIQDPDRRRQVGQALRRRAQERYSWTAAARRIVHVYRQLQAHRRLVTQPVSLQVDPGPPESRKP